MKRAAFFLLICTIPVFTTCRDRYLPDGAGCRRAEFDVDALSFDAQGGSKRITSKRDSWWIYSEPYLEGVSFEDFIVTKEEGDIVKMEFVNGSLSMIMWRVRGKVVKIEYPSWFTVEKDSPKSLTFTLAPNTAGSPRKFELWLTSGNCGETVEVTQAAAAE
ncbi:MAG: hypothetical protein LBH72_02085 [Proteiniphilum sp.]|jgi:hypothetical protein|nr:hypothetical protein [Proteiniphilum sp.]